MTALTVCHFFEAKHNLAEVLQAGRHNLRQYLPAEADPARSHLNQILHGPVTGEEIALLLTAKIAAAINAKVKKTSRIMAELLLSASPEYFRPTNPMVAGLFDPARTMTWAEKNLAWLKEKYGDNLLSVTLHLDENTPHIHAIIVPLTDDGRLSYKNYISDHPSDLKILQNEYAKVVADFGIRRGLDNSPNTHNSKKEYNLALQHFHQNIPEPPETAETKYKVEKPKSKKLLEKIVWTTATVQAEVDKMLRIRDEEWEQKTKGLAAHLAEMELERQKTSALAARRYAPQIQNLTNEIENLMAELMELTKKNELEKAEKELKIQYHKAEIKGLSTENDILDTALEEAYAKIKADQIEMDGIKKAVFDEGYEAAVSKMEPKIDKFQATLEGIQNNLQATLAQAIAEGRASGLKEGRQLAVIFGELQRQAEQREAYEKIRADEAEEKFDSLLADYTNLREQNDEDNSWISYYEAVIVNDDQEELSKIRAKLLPPVEPSAPKLPKM